MATNSLPETLQSLGFTKYEIAVLLKLYENGPSTADGLKGDKIPLSRVYDALDILKRKNFVTISQGRPKIYSPVSPKNAIDSMLDKEKKEQEEIISKKGKLASAFLNQVESKYQFHTEITPDDLLIQFSTLKEAEEKTVKMISSATSSIDIFTHLFNWYPQVKKELEEAISRGCKVRILLQGDINEALVKELKSKGAEVKVLNEIKIFTRGTITDNKSVLFVIWVDRYHKEGKKIYRPQYSTNLGIVEVFHLSFEHLFL